MIYASIIERVENSLKTLGIEAAQAKSDEGQYTISKDGDIEVMIDVWEQGGLVFFQVMAPVSQATEQVKESLCKQILEENHRLVESSFTIINNTIFVKETVECGVFFTQERVISVITRIAYYCETYKGRWD